MSNLKIYGTTVILRGVMWERAQSLGFKNNEARIICLARSMDNANYICNDYGFARKVFNPAYTVESFNRTEQQLCESCNVWLQISGSRDYISIYDLIGSEGSQ